MSGSGHAALALPAKVREPAPLLLLREAGAPATAKPRGPVLATYRYTPHGFTHASVEASHSSGNNLVFAPASSTCKAKLAIASAVSGAPTVLESADKNTWAPRTIASFPDPQALAGAIALGDLDGDGCSDFAVSYSSLIAGAWHSVVDVYLDRGQGWKRINLLNGSQSDRVTAMTAAGNSAGTLLLTLDDVGTLRAYRFGGDSMELVIDAPTAEWRKGCAGSDIHVLPDDVSGRSRLAASFAGEPTMGQFDRCRNGGGIEAWRIDQ